MGPGVLSAPFPRRDGRIHCGDVPAADLAARYGTPLYVYDMRSIRERIERFRSAFGSDALLAYSVKANGNLELLRRLRAAGCGADITSLGELFRARKAGIPPESIVFAGVGKTEGEIAAAMQERIYGFNVESEGELERIARVAAGMGVRAPFAVRVNPDVVADTPHEYTATGHAATKFGVPLDRTRALYRWALDQPSLLPRGVDVHIGSQIVEVRPYLEALDRVLALVEDLRGEGIPLEYLDMGGGFGIRYDQEPGLDIDALAAEVVPRVKASGLRLVLEPGRAVVGEAGLLLTRVQYVKRTAAKTFVIVDGGMSELIRPSHYGGYHKIEPVDAMEGRAPETVDVVGPVCETGDFLARNRDIDMPEPGELLAVHTAGAYGFVMASNYNGRLRPAEILVDGADVRLVRRRETLDDLIRAEEDL
ncbi:MAG: diaminopimelate decarboxylase [Longimicrobiales bacterium]